MFGSTGVEALVRPVVIVRADRARSTVRVFGELDGDSSTELVDVTVRGVNAWARVEVSLESVWFIDAAGLGALVGLHRRFCAAGGGLTVIDAPDHIRRVFELGGLADLFTGDRTPTPTPLPPRADQRGLAVTAAS
jgi:anti-anti-sigma factor